MEARLIHPRRHTHTSRVRQNVVCFGSGGEYFCKYSILWILFISTFQSHPDMKGRSSGRLLHPSLSSSSKYCSSLCGMLASVLYISICSCNRSIRLRMKNTQESEHVHETICEKTPRCWAGLSRLVQPSAVSFNLCGIFLG